MPHDLQLRRITPNLHLDEANGASSTTGNPGHTVPDKQNSTVNASRGQPSWRDLIGLALVAIVLVNLLAVTVVLLFGPPPHRYGLIGMVWLVGLIGLALFALLWRSLAHQQKPPRTPLV